MRATIHLRALPAQCHAEGDGAATATFGTPTHAAPEVLTDGVLSPLSGALAF